MLVLRPVSVRNHELSVRRLLVHERADKAIAQRILYTLPGLHRSRRHVALSLCIMNPLENVGPVEEISPKDSLCGFRQCALVAFECFHINPLVYVRSMDRSTEINLELCPPISNRISYRKLYTEHLFCYTFICRKYRQNDRETKFLR